MHFSPVREGELQRDNQYHNEQHQNTLISDFALWRHYLFSYWNTGLSSEQKEIIKKSESRFLALDVKPEYEIDKINNGWATHPSFSSNILLLPFLRCCPLLIKISNGVYHIFYFLDNLNVKALTVKDIATTFHIYLYFIYSLLIFCQQCVLHFRVFHPFSHSCLGSPVLLHRCIILISNDPLSILLFPAAFTVKQLVWVRIAQLIPWRRTLPRRFLAKNILPFPATWLSSSDSSWEPFVSFLSNLRCGNLLSIFMLN